MKMKLLAKPAKPATNWLGDMNDRNYRILLRRVTVRHNEHEMAMDMNADWRKRMWQTPDVAMCLGRFNFK